jgi:hypothetical protein
MKRTTTKTKTTTTKMKMKMKTKKRTVRARPCSNKRQLNQRQNALRHGQDIAISRGNPNNNELKRVTTANYLR